MSDSREGPVTLEFPARQARRVLDEVGTLRDGLNVVMEIVLRHDREFERLNSKLDDMLRQMAAMVAQHQRFSDRVAGMDARLAAVEDKQQA